MVSHDEELTILLTKLYAIQEQVGAVEKSSDEDKKNRAASAGQVQMGKGRKGKKTGSRFLELKSSIIDRLKSVATLQEEFSSSVSLDPKVKIATQAEIRELVRQAQDEWSELNEMYKKEARKKKSKFTPEELETQQSLVMELQAQIEKVKDVQMAGYSRGGMVDEGVTLNLGALAALDAVDFDSANGELICCCFCGPQYIGYIDSTHDVCHAQIFSILIFLCLSYQIHLAAANHGHQEPPELQ